MLLRSARALAVRHLIDLSPRWQHVQGVGTLAERLWRLGAISEAVAAAAWVHDLGYAPDLDRLGFHPLDGAVYLDGQGASSTVVALVAHHSGATTEAGIRGLRRELDALPLPVESDLETVTLLDMSIGPTGRWVTPAERLDEILRRHPPEDPVHQARAHDRDDLLAAAERARARLGSAFVSARVEPASSTIWSPRRR